jgi:Na+-driven multidrug efflux pump
MSNRLDPLTGEVVPVFFRYAIPSVIGILAATSAGIIDGFFIGNYVGADALAAVNISIPAFYLFAAMVFMLAIGGSVTCGKYIGENNTDADLHPLVRDYMIIILAAAPLLIIGFTLDFFVQVDNRPVLAAVSMGFFAVTNVALNWIFIVQWGWGLKGAAWATALAEAGIVLILGSHLLHPKCTLKLVSVPLRWKNCWDEVFQAAWNGFSEFANEVSIGLITLLFNWVMITRMGVAGVAAFAIVGYLLMLGIEVCYGFSGSLGPTVSKNLGARRPDRITQFALIATISSFVFGLLISVLFIAVPDFLVSIFLGEGETETEAIALSFIAVFWPAFLFNGANISLAAYFTAMHKPMQSAIIALSRSLVLPCLGLLLLPTFLGDVGVFMAIPIAEGLTLLLAMWLVSLNRPSRLVAQLPPTGDAEAANE